MTTRTTVSEVSSAASVPPVRPEDLGRYFGPYRTLERIGQGGMGEIFLAQRDDAYHQQVAVKVLRRGLDTDDMLWRFRRERQILAGLEHPYIARLYGGGTCQEGRPYLVMERVDGSPIDRYCDEGRLDISQRLRLFVKVCEAVTFAHRGLLVHRDLKPNNILVQDDGIPKLLDFGIAKPLMPVADPSDPDDDVHGPLTPGYASPEQVLGGTITTSSDVYSLGVLLYRLLCGHVPLRSIRDLMDGRDLPVPSTHFADSVRKEELERALRKRRTTLRGLRHALTGDLDHVLLKALQLEPSRRYPSANELARDVERHLQGRPVGARAPHPFYVANKFLKRHRRVGVALAVVALVLISGLVSIERARREADLERQRAWKVQDFLLGTFDLGPEGSELPALSAVELLELTEQRLQRRTVDDPHVDIALRTSLSRMFGQLARHDAAERLATEALAEHRRHQGDDATAAPLIVHLARSAFQEGRLAAAEMHYRDAGQRLKGSGSRKLSTRLAKETESDILYGLSSIAWDRGRLEEGIDLLSQTLELRKTLYDEPHRRIADVASDLGVLLIAARRFDEGEALLFEARDAYKATLGDTHPSLLISQNHLAFLHFQRRRLDTAEAAFRENLEQSLRQGGPRHPYSRIMRRQLARTLLFAHRLDEAVALMEINLDFHSADAEDGALAADLQLYGRILRRLGRPGEALPPLQRALDLHSQLDIGDTVGQAYDVYYLAQVEGDLDRPRAVQRLRRVQTVFARHLPEEAFLQASLHFEIGRLLLRLGHAAEAQPELEQALQSFPPENTPLHAIQVAFAETLLGASQMATDSLDGLNPLNRGVNALEQELGPEHPWTLEAASYLEGSDPGAHQ